MNNPVSTYRLQFHKEFSFHDFESLIPYFRKLGIGTIYASPILASTAGSTHGYDGVDPGLVDPEIGTLETLRHLSSELRESGINWLQDIVPNHMAFHPENPWLMDVLEKGKQSAYASFFDIAWTSGLFHGKIMVPFLAKEVDEAISDGDVKIGYDGTRFVIDASGQAFPVNLRSYSVILNRIQNKSQAVTQLIEQLDAMNQIEDAPSFSQRWDEWILQLRALYSNEDAKQAISSAVAEINADPALIQEIAGQQNYALCHWQRTEEEINFRRFFTVNGLVCLNIQDDQVFDKYHELIKQLTQEGVFQGLRIDHIDGLFDPAQYLEKLRGMAGSDTYIVAEKILGAKEDLPTQWPIEGTTGYEFLAVVNNLFTNASAQKTFTTYYNELTSNDRSPGDQLLSKKSEILYGHMGGELNNLFQLFTQLELADAETIERVGPEAIKKAIGEFLIHCPVYRYYGNAMPLAQDEARAVQSIFEDINKHHPDLSPAVDVLEECLINRPALDDEAYNRRAAEFYQRCMQFTGPLMAKGGEDTLMYTYNRFIGHNDVGDSPERFGLSGSDFHKYMKRRQKEWPMAINATSTHDTKRGEDVRARLNVLTDLADEWLQQVKDWQQANAGLKKDGAGPDGNDEYLIYQTMVGAYPMPGEEEDDFESRLKDYLQKALREAKTNSTWAEPNEAYEAATAQFAKSLLSDGSAFALSFHGFQESIADFGIINSLAQLALKFTCPGIPDVYQGCELWDLSLVDPDNRREVDFAKRKLWLDELEDYQEERLAEKLWADRRNGQIKLWLTQRLFKLRRQFPLLFTHGEYLPLKIRGAYKEHLLAFARIHKRDVFITVIPLHTAIISREQGKDFFELDWQDTHVVLPENLLPEWDDVLTGHQNAFQTKLMPSEIFAGMPFAVLQGKRVDNERNAGLLLHITSLPSPFGVGDIGPAAFEFVDFLEKTNQKMWQILPLNPTEAAQGNSPYSALSSMAGNPLLISPEALVKDGWLSEDELSEFHMPESSSVDYEKAAENKEELLEQAFAHYAQNQDNHVDQLNAFKQQSSAWLEDFAAYMVLKRQFEGKPWHTWPEEYRNRDEQALAKLKETHANELALVEWEQYVFDKQWKQLRTYCNEREIRLLGDIPFYVSYDSADVWANRELFCVDEDGKLTGVAGVPPDAFSEDGQLWGMPVFNWNAVKASGYEWWINRLARNMEMFDLIRLDHFRAFADYWEVPGDEKTAVNGEWKTGPGEEFFRKAETALGQLPFIAEDLGEISPEVYQLRDKFSLPGMKVLQFAFDENMSQSDHIPHLFKHNFIAYTGTHDNNTTLGWFKEAADTGTHERLAMYMGKEVSEDTVVRDLTRLLYSSIAKTAILPVQDLLNLDESAKMNLPGSSGDNWAWRLVPGQLNDEAARFLTEVTVLYNRE